MPGPVTVAVFTGRIEAELARARLEAEGIAAALLTDDGGGMYPNLAASGVRLVTAPEDAEAARRVLAE